MSQPDNPEDAFDRLGVVLGLTVPSEQPGSGSAVWNGPDQLIITGPSPVETEGEQQS